MKNYKLSICSTCRNMLHCSLTRNHQNIYSCSEYVHELDKDYFPLTLVSLEITSEEHFQNEQNIIVIL